MFRFSAQFKMASLVADYSSDDDSDRDSEQARSCPPVQPEEPGINYLIPEEDDSSDSGEAKMEPEEKLPNPIMSKLPKPKLSKKKKKDKKVQLTAASVFTNPFERAEMAKQSMLEKHVKMTEGVNPTGKKICRKFKQGKCRFEKNCKYSHDLDANLSLRYMQEDVSSNVGDNNEFKGKNYPRLPPPPKSQGFMGTLDSLKAASGPKYTAKQTRHFREQERHMVSPDEDVDDRGIADDKRKRRIGLSQSLVPPKKAMSSLTKQRMEERPWTYKK